MRISDWSSDVCSSDLVQICAELEHLKLLIVEIEEVGVHPQRVVQPLGFRAQVEAVQLFGLHEEGGLDGILSLAGEGARLVAAIIAQVEDRKSTRLNSSH